MGDEAKGQGFKIGDRVGGPMWQQMCLTCDECKYIGLQHCSKMEIKGISHDGCFSEYTLMDIKSAVKIPGEGEEGLDAYAPIFCAGITVFDSIKKAKLRPESTIAVVGAGGLGHLLVQMAVAMGHRVIAIDIHEGPLNLAKELGAIATINSAKVEDLAAEVCRLTPDGKGVHAVIVTSASNRAYEPCLSYVRYGGCLVVVGLAPGTMPVSPAMLFFKYISIVVGRVPDSKISQQCVDFCAQHNIKPHITKYKLEQINEMIDTMVKEAQTGRMVVIF